MEDVEVKQKSEAKEDIYIQKYIIYLDDDGQTKKKVAFILLDSNGVSIKFSKEQIPFWIPHNRILKIKEVKEDKDGRR